MFIHSTLSSGIPLGIIVPQRTEHRLQHECFRGPTVRAAGNFSAYRNARELFNDDDVMREQFLNHVYEMWSLKGSGSNGVTLTHTMPIGWERTAPLARFGHRDLERVQINIETSGLQVKSSRQHLRARATTCCTVLYWLKRDERHHARILAIVSNMYVGEGAGNLRGKVTDRKEHVFFPLDHPVE